VVLSSTRGNFGPADASLVGILPGFAGGNHPLACWVNPPCRHAHHGALGDRDELFVCRPAQGAQCPLRIRPFALHSQGSLEAATGFEPRLEGPATRPLKMALSILSHHGENGLSSARPNGNRCELAVTNHQSSTHRDTCHPLDLARVDQD